MATRDFVTKVSTHSRLKAAGPENNGSVVVIDVSTHSRLKAAGNLTEDMLKPKIVSTHSRLKAAGPTSQKFAQVIELFQHTAA